MSKQKFIQQTEIFASPELVFAWHEQPGVVEMLTPPWERVKVLVCAEDIKPGACVVFRVYTGPIGLDWVAEHTEYEPPYLFADIQRKGPFAYWYHRHRFERTERNTTMMIDEVDYELPLGVLGEIFGGAFTRRKLKRMFDYRHHVVSAAFERK